MLHGEKNKNGRLEKLVTEIMGLGFFFFFFFFSLGPFIYLLNMTFLLLFFIRIIYISFEYDLMF
jgi:hypothetical protein